MIRKLFLPIMLLMAVYGSAQNKKQVAITMDDAPFTQWAEEVPLKAKRAANEKLLKVISDNKVPVALFINENTLQGPEAKERIEVLNQWLTNPLITSGNHAYSHPNFNTTSIEAFEQEIIKGEMITKQLLTKTKKQLTYFRFPYNATGKDSVSRFSMEQFLKSKGYISTPFTVESQDYMFNSIYQQELDRNDLKAAQETGRAYIDFTLQSFDYFEKLSKENYGRNIAQIYLCHDNQLNADYMAQLITELKKAGYTFVSLDEAMRDKVYQQPSWYTGEYGFSWMYRWEKDVQKRRQMMRAQPEVDSPVQK